MKRALPTRRDFLGTSLRAGLAVGAVAGFGVPAMEAMEPLRRPGKARLSLGLAAYSFRSYFKDPPPKRESMPEAAKQIDLFQFIDFCADHGCDGAELTSYYFPSTIDSAFLLRIKRHAFLRGIAVCGTAVGNIFTLPKGEKRDREVAQVKKWVDYAQVMGAPHIRIFAGTAGNLSKDEARKYSLEAIEECCDYSGSKGVILGLENHGGIVAEADDLLEIVRAVKSPWFGINLDTGNFQTDDPYGDLARCAPYAVNVQFKVEMQRRGEKKGPADLSRVVQILREANYQGYFTLEYEAAEDPWKAVPEYLKRMRESI